MLEYIFNTGEILCIPDCSIEYINVIYCEKRWPKLDEDGNPLKDNMGSMVYEPFVYLKGKKILFKYTFRDTLEEIRFFPENPELNINDDEEYNRFLSFLKSAFVKNNKKRDF